MISFLWASASRSVETSAGRFDSHADCGASFQDLNRIASFDYPQAARIDREAFLPQFVADEDRLLTRGQVAFKEREGR